MRGEILTYDDGPGAGLISGDDGLRYTFARADLQQLTPVRAGMKVDFVAEGGAATQVIVLAQQPAGFASTAYTPGVAGSGMSAFDWRTLFLEANGRIGQKDYWIGIIILFAAGVVLSWVPLIGQVVTLASIYFGVCVSSKRLHDMGKSGWLAAIPYGITTVAVVLSAMAFVGGIVSTSYGNDYAMLAGIGGIAGLWGLVFIVNLGFLIWLGVTAGQPGDNAYGPPPRPLANF